MNHNLLAQYFFNAARKPPITMDIATNCMTCIHTEKSWKMFDSEEEARKWLKSKQYHEI